MHVTMGIKKEIESGYVQTEPSKDPVKNKSVYALDCEMVSVRLQ